MKKISILVVGFILSLTCFVYFVLGIEFNFQTFAFEFKSNEIAVEIDTPITKKDVLYIEEKMNLRYLDYDTIKKLDPTFIPFDIMAETIEDYPAYERSLIIRESISKLTDYHTNFKQVYTFGRLPIIFDLIDGKLIIINAYKEYEHLIGKSISRIEEHEALDLLERVKNYSEGDNDTGKYLSAIEDLNTQDIYIMLSGVIKDNLVLEVEGQTIKLPWSKYSTDYSKFINNGSNPFAFGSNVNMQYTYAYHLDPFTYTYDKERQVVLLHVNYLMNYDPQIAYDFRETFYAFLEANQVKTVVFDFRRCMGGSGTEVGNVFIKLLKDDSYKKYSFVSRLSFSAGTQTPYYLQKSSGVQIIGENSGYSPYTSGVQMAPQEYPPFDDMAISFRISGSNGDYEKRLKTPYLTLDYELEPVLEDFLGTKDTWLEILDTLN